MLTKPELIAEAWTSLQGLHSFILISQLHTFLTLVKFKLFFFFLFNLLMPFTHFLHPISLTTTDIFSCACLVFLLVSTYKRKQTVLVFLCLVYFTQHDIYIYHNSFIHSSIDGHLGSFHILTIVNSASMNMGAYSFSS